jgi:hypothetical protein
MNAFVTVHPDTVNEAGEYFNEAGEYLVNLYQAPEGDSWIAEADALPIATKAETIDALIERAWLIAPEIAELNEHTGDLNLRFIVHTRAVSWRARFTDN